MMRKVRVSGARRRSVLVVEDEFLIAIELQSILENAGFHVLGPAFSIDGALDILRNHRPNAALLDINLRGQFVTPVARRLEALGVPFVLSSAYAAYAAALDDVFVGAPMLDKPVRDAQLISVLTGVVNTGPAHVNNRVQLKKCAARPKQAFGP
jgi:two-component system, response regulator PdtaR